MWELQNPSSEEGQPLVREKSAGKSSGFLLRKCGPSGGGVKVFQKSSMVKTKDFSKKKKTFHFSKDS